MTEYWKSQARKYCEFCKCWFADNKVSISFHENGKRHKENVQKHISKLSKKSAKEFKQKEKMDDDIKKMESAAMAAYLKDVQNNADLTSQSINDILGQSESSASSTSIVVNDVKVPPVWHEAKSEDGSSYFWNTETNSKQHVDISNMQMNYTTYTSFNLEKQTASLVLSKVFISRKRGTKPY